MSERTRFIVCEVMKDAVLSEGVRPEDCAFVTMGLHLHPAKLHRELQLRIDQVCDADRIVLGFGLCGGALDSIKAGSIPLVVPRVHDCIPLFLGSRERYEELAAVRGSFYLSAGWMKGERSLASEYRRSVDRYGREKGGSLMKRMFESYSRLLFIRTDALDDAAFEGEAKALASELGLHFRTTDGRREYVQSLVHGPWGSGHFLHVRPGETVSRENF